jgi:8-hydroxy-5-deazaflavin:NADPH oxidoreductase
MANTVRVGIIGAGKIGSRLGRRLSAAGYAVTFGVRDAAEAAEKLEGIDAPIVSPKEAAAGSDVVLLTVPANAAHEAASALELRPGAILVDCTNPMRWDGGPVWAPPAEGSMAASLAAAFPGVRLVKAFNHFGAEIHEDPIVGGEKADAFVAGDDGDARTAVLTLANAIGFHGLDAGPLRNASLLENLAVLWIQLAGSGKGRHFAFKAVGR